MPWLVGILNHLAQDARRQRARRERAALPPPKASDDPARLAADAEFRAVFANALRGLPEPYRAVVALHLDDGLRAADIAARLRRRTDTARKQLARGLAMLRQALPPSLATAPVVLATPTRGLAAVRAAVLARVPKPVAVAGAVTATLTWGGLLVNKLVVSLAAAVVVTGAVYGWRQLAVDAGRESGRRQRLRHEQSRRRHRQRRNDPPPRPTPSGCWRRSATSHRVRIEVSSSADAASMPHARAPARCASRC